MKITKYILIALIALPISAAAQTICNFETTDYTTLKTYDDWIDSPFNNGKLTGNVAVVANTIANDVNNSEKIVAFQRSRYGSHIFGAEIGLTTPFELTQTTKYVHVLIHKPVNGRVMLVGLGKRPDRPGQSDRVVQFYSTSGAPAGQWADAVFPITGNGGIMISSLVVVPDCESPHNLDADFMTYIDNIEINDSPIARFKKGEYIVNFDEYAINKRTDRHLDGVKFTGDKGGKLSVTAPEGTQYGYRKLLESVGFAVPGEIITPAITFTGNWMHGYVYIDFNNDGKFNIDLNTDGTPAAVSDVASYSYFNQKNSVGADLSGAGKNNPGVNSPAFTLPADMAHGIYRMRYKVDWDFIDAGGNNKAGNLIIDNNGGGIIDILLNVHKATSHVKIATRNGDILRDDNSIFVETDIPFGQPITIALKPENGFKQNGVTIKHGYLDKDEFIMGNRQWKTETIAADKFIDGKYTIPAEYVDGDMEITAEFAELTAVPKVNADDNLQIKTSKQTMTISVKKPAYIAVNDLSGKTCFSGHIEADRKLCLPAGVYFVNKNKVIVP